MAAPWESPYDVLPSNNDEVWIRVITYYGPPVHAIYRAVQMRFETVTTNIDVPTYMVARWKPYP